jgi:hypothetical protein
MVPNISQTQTLSAGDTLIVSLPENSICDLNTFAWFFKGKCDSTGVALPKNIETLIHKISLEVNGQMVDPGFTHYGLLFRKLADLSMGDKESLRKIYQNAGEPVLASLGSNASCYGASSDQYQQFCVKNWLSFIGTAQPSCIDTSILGSVRVHITLAPNSVLRKNYPAGSVSYTIKDNYFTIDTISLNDGVYYNIVNERLGSENPIEIPFQTWVHFSRGNASLDQETQATLSTESLDMMVGTYQQSNWTDNADVSAMLAPSYFSTGSSNFEWSQFSVNNVPYPPFQQQAHDCYESTQQALGLSQDILGSGTPNLDTPAEWKNNYFVHAVRFSHPTASDERIRSGLNLRGTNSTLTWKTYGSEANIVPHVWAGITSVLRVKPYKQLEVVP